MEIKNLNYKKIKNTMIKGCAYALSIGILPFLGQYHVKAEESIPPIIDLTDDQYVSSKIGNDTFYIPCMYMVLFDDGRIISSDQKIFSLDDLNHIVSATIVVDENNENQYDFLNYMTNLKDLTFNDKSITSRLSCVDGTIFQEGIDISIYTYPEICSFNENRYGFLSDVKDIHSLTVGNHDFSLNIDSIFLQSLKNVHHLSLGLDYNSNFKYTDLSYLDSFMIDSEPYDACIYFSCDDIKKLQDKGVEVTTLDMNKLLSASSIIHDISLSFPLYSDSTDQEKLNAILNYVLNQFHYDEKVHSLNVFGDPFGEKDYTPFYGKGELTGVFENRSQICGNYAAMVYALCREVGLNCYNLISPHHAWNAIEIGNYYYYVDATWLDQGILYLPMSDKIISAEELFANNELDLISELDWYLEDPIQVFQNFNDTSHQLSFLPEGLDILPIPDDIEYLTKQGYAFSKEM